MFMYLENEVVQNYNTLVQRMKTQTSGVLNTRYVGDSTQAINENDQS